MRIGYGVASETFNFQRIGGLRCGIENHFPLS
jgi:hypothetical protein